MNSFVEPIIERILEIKSTTWITFLAILKYFLLGFSSESFFSNKYNSLCFFFFIIILLIFLKKMKLMNDNIILVLYLEISYFKFI
jgi:hypothetical protein